MEPVHSGRGDISRSLELMWHGRETAARGPRPALTLDRIVTAAVALADRDGIAALSMRNVAAELGVGTMSLYRYVPGKAELLDLMLDHVNAPDGDPDAHRDKDWRAILTLVAEGTYRLYLDHPWLLQVNQSRPLLGPNALLGFEFALRGLADLGLTGQEKVQVIMTVDSYVTGIARYHVLREQASRDSGVSDEEFWAQQGPLMTTAYHTGRYPEVFGLAEDAFAMGAEESMRFGLDRVLDGCAALVGGRARRKPADG
ncbi:TetR/AcrR family transcriptional regulator [Streptomyces sp. MS19]|uniref:TetR/AcrR family transcriptional regulator n=1 Tax=Streptomyces sp. MS19 TaxID=3385972 RepID=UPI00399EF136